MRGYGTKLVWNLGFRVKSSNHPIQTQEMPRKTRDKSTKIRGDKATKLYNKTPCALQETQWCPRSMHHQIAMKQSLTAGRREKGWRDVCNLLTPSKKKCEVYMLLERGSMRRWSGQSTCSSWCKLGARCPSSCDKYRRGPRCPEEMGTRSRTRRAITTTTTRRRSGRRTASTSTRTTTFTTN